MITIHLEGLTDAVAALKRLPQATQKTTLRRLATAALQPIATAARALAPVGTQSKSLGRRKRTKKALKAAKPGQLRRSIRVSAKLSRRQAGLFRLDDPNDIVVHVGPGPLPQSHLEEFGGGHNRMHAYMRPAVDEKKGAIQQFISEGLWKEIVIQATKVAIKRTASGDNGS